MIYLIVLIILPFVFFILPADYFDQGSSVCPSKMLLNTECLGCGMTRATQHMIHLELRDAWSHNKLSFLVVPLIVYFYIREITIQVKLVREAKN